jgi:hypothetical protein
MNPCGFLKDSLRIPLGFMRFLKDSLRSPEGFLQDVLSISHGILEYFSRNPQGILKDSWRIS